MNEWAVDNGYWIVVFFWLLTIVCLGIVGYQRDKAQDERNTYRYLLIKRIGWDPLKPGYREDH
jgi:hypothetical protein